MSTQTLSLESSPSFITSEEAHKAAYENGFRVELGRQSGWIGYRSTIVRGEVWIARPTPEQLAIGDHHGGVVSEISLSRAQISNAPGQASYAFSNLSGLYDALDRAYKLGVSLPDAPLEVFRKLTANLPRSTEAERLTVVRIGQDVFRDALLEYWNSRCPFTDITDPALLRASHIVPWAECESDDLRLDRRIQ